MSSIMNGIHDVGGMHGFGAVPDDDAIFHADWEREMYALNRLLLTAGVYNSHESRHATERMAPARYLSAGYFERWLESKTALAVEKGALTEAEIEERTAAIAAGDVSLEAVEPPPDSDPLTAAEARAALQEGARAPQPPDEARFEPGEEVTVRNASPAGHTRCPRYVRGATGTVDEIHGVFELPDAKAHGREYAEPCYAVEFTARELWGSEHSSTDRLYIDLWERYLRVGETVK